MVGAVIRMSYVMCEDGNGYGSDTLLTNGDVWSVLETLADNCTSEGDGGVGQAAYEDIHNEYDSDESEDSNPATYMINLAALDLED